jgi:hypothetical protein
MTLSTASTRTIQTHQPDAKNQWFDTAIGSALLKRKDALPVVLHVGHNRVPIIEAVAAIEFCLARSLEICGFVSML